jgi:hypothetical protein
MPEPSLRFPHRLAAPRKSDRLLASPGIRSLPNFHRRARRIGSEALWTQRIGLLVLSDQKRFMVPICIEQDHFSRLIAPLHRRRYPRGRAVGDGTQRIGGEMGYRRCLWPTAAEKERKRSIQHFAALRCGYYPGDQISRPAAYT